MGTQGRISSIQSMGTLDGEGVRFVVFLQGCPLRCFYCHNPETWAMDLGEEYTSQQLMEKIQRYKPYFSRGGGVTFSGGEPLCQPAFLLEMLQQCREEKIHTTLDTSATRWDATVQEIYSLVDMVLLDIKADSEAQYQALCGGSYQPVIETLRYLEKQQKPTWVRRVMVPQYNENSILALAETLKGLTCVKKVELLPFRKLCLEKYQQRGIPFGGECYPEAEEQMVHQLEDQLATYITAEYR